MKVDTVSNISFPVKQDNKPVTKPENYILCEPVKDEFVKYDAVEQYKLEKEQRQKEFEELAKRPQRFQK